VINGYYLHKSSLDWPCWVEREPRRELVHWKQAIHTQNNTNVWWWQSPLCFPIQKLPPKHPTKQLNVRPTSSTINVIQSACLNQCEISPVSGQWEMTMPIMMVVIKNQCDMHTVAFCCIGWLFCFLFGHIVDCFPFFVTTLDATLHWNQPWSAPHWLIVFSTNHGPCYSCLLFA